MTEVKFFERTFIPEAGLTYAVVSAKFDNKWVFVRHQDRLTWEIPGGHIEIGESADEAASRELFEETGALRFDIECLATYSVSIDGKTGFGRYYFAEIHEIGEIPDISEIAERILLDTLPSNLTYPLIQPILFRKSIEYLESQKKLDAASDS